MSRDKFSFVAMQDKFEHVIQYRVTLSNTGRLSVIITIIIIILIIVIIGLYFLKITY